MRMTSLDHLVLRVADVAAPCRFYERMPGLDVCGERPGKGSPHVGAQKERVDAAGPIMSIQFRDPDGNLDEVGSPA